MTIDPRTLSWLERAAYRCRQLLAALPGGVLTARTPDGTRVYFGGVRTPWGPMAQRAAAGLVLPLPDSLDEVTAAAIVNPGVGAWLALTRRAALQRSSGLETLGSGPGTIPLSEITGATPGFMAIGDLPIEIDEVPLAEVEVRTIS